MYPPFQSHVGPQYPRPPGVMGQMRPPPQQGMRPAGPRPGAMPSGPQMRPYGPPVSGGPGGAQPGRGRPAGLGSQARPGTSSLVYHFECLASSACCVVHPCAFLIHACQPWRALPASSRCCVNRRGSFASACTAGQDGAHERAHSRHPAHQAAWSSQGRVAGADLHHAHPRHLHRRRPQGQK